MVIRRGASGDAAALAALAERTFRDAFAADNNAGDMDKYCATAYAPQIQGAQLADRDVDTLVVEADAALIAYAQLRPGAMPQTGDLDPPRAALPHSSLPHSLLPRSQRTIELWRFYVDRAHHGRGVAASLMDAAVAAARERGAETMWLGVWERNLRAQAFYRKAGFADVGSHQFVLGSDVQTDRVMVRRLTEFHDGLP